MAVTQKQYDKLRKQLLEMANVEFKDSSSMLYWLGRAKALRAKCKKIYEQSEVK